MLISSSSDTVGSVLNVAAGAKSKFRMPLWSWRRAIMGLYLALGLAAVGTHSDAARALDAGAPAPPTKWCVVQHDGNSDQPTCYENLITCVMTALAHAGWCTQQPQVPASIDAMNRRAPAAAVLPRRRTHHHKFSAAERDKLYHEFEKWQERSTSE